MFNAALRPARWITVLVALAAVTVVPAVDRTEAVHAATSDACGARIAKSNGTLWACSFVDNFSGTSLDPAKWTAQNTALSGFYMHDTCFKPSTGYLVKDGTLRLSVRRVSAFTCKTPGEDFTSRSVGGAVSTYAKFAQAYGRFEARVKFPAYTGAGLHGGFWMNPQERVYGAWPASGEIDVAEWFSAVANRVYPSLHYTGRTAADTAWTCAPGRTDVFHTYRVTWSRTSMQFHYDGQLCFSRSWAPADMDAPKPFDQPFTAALISALGAGDNAPTSSTPKTSTTVVDYVKVWR